MTTVNHDRVLALCKKRWWGVGRVPPRFGAVWSVFSGFRIRRGILERMELTEHRPAWMAIGDMSHVWDGDADGGIQ